MREVELITSLKNPAVIAAAALFDKKARDARGVFLAEGKRILSDVTETERIVEIFVKEDKKELLLLAQRFSCPLRVVSDAVFQKLSDTVNGEGIIAVVAKREADKAYGNRILVLDSVADPANVGTLLRSAKAFRFDTVVSLSSADFYSPKVVRGSMGAVISLNLIQTEEDGLRDILKDYTVYASDMDGEEIKTVCALPRLALVVGNEARGISRTIVAMATKLVKIAMPGTIESLNAGVAGSIIMYQFIEEGLQ